MNNIDRVREAYAKAAEAANAAYSHSLTPEWHMAREVAEELNRRAKCDLQALDDVSLMKLVGEQTVVPLKEEKAA